MISKPGSALLAGLLLAGAAGTPAAQAPAAPGRRLERKVPFKVGEHLKYAIQYGIINAGWATLEVQDGPAVGGRPLMCVERPQSRLSKRTTWKPRPASRSQNSSGHPIICVPRPMISNSGGSDSSPMLS